jgi:Protein of unknown function (DUF3833)
MKTEVTSGEVFMRFILLLFTAVALGACSSTNVKIYEAEKPELALETYFNSKMKGHGLVMDRSGEVIRRFVVQLDAHWMGQVGTLKEDFTWADGEKSQRVWTMTKTSEESYEGTADDVIGKSTGKTAGNALHWTYKMDLKTKDSRHDIDFDDWMFLVDENVLINEATMYWHGFRVGKILISFDKNSK